MAKTAKIRIQSLDIIRGIAVMGIVVMNIYAFGGPAQMYWNPTAYGGAEGIDRLVWWFQMVIIDKKMFGLFTLLFGASALLVMDRATQSGRSAAITHFSRMFWLLLIGLAHYYFIWWGDILAAYAMVGFSLYFFRNFKAQTLVYIAIGALAISTLISVSNSSLMKAYFEQPETIPVETMEVIEPQMDMMLDMFSAEPEYVDAELERYRGSYGKSLSYRLNDRRWFPIFEGLALYTVGLPMMLLGMALYRTGFLTGGWPRSRIIYWTTIAGVLGLAGAAWNTSRIAAGEFSVASLVAAASNPIGTIANVLLAIAWAGLILIFIRPGNDGPVVQRVAATGRMAFTNYLMTSIVMTIIFYGFGFGLFGDFGRAELQLFTIAMWAVMLFWSKPWLDRFHYGPFEWLWRSLARLKPQPMLKKQAPGIAD